MVKRTEGEKREATPAEAKAVANPLRLRILRECWDEALTNKELADRLGKDPGSLLHHVRTLVRTGFLRAERVRRGPSGALEKPYRATGKSWRIEVTDRRASVDLELAMIDAFRDEFAAAPRGDEPTIMTRLALTLDAGEALAELRDRIEAIVKELADRPEDVQGDHYALFLALHGRH